MAAFVGKLLRMDTLQALSRQLAAAAAALSPAAAGPAPTGAAAVGAGLAGPAGPPAGAGQAPAAPSMVFRNRCCWMFGSAMWLIQGMSLAIANLILAAKGAAPEPALAAAPSGRVAEAAPSGGVAAAAAAPGSAAAAAAAGSGVVTAAAAPGSSGAAAAAPPALPKAVAALLTLFEQAMTRSGVLEHAGRLLMLVPPPPRPLGPDRALGLRHSWAAVSFFAAFRHTQRLITSSTTFVTGQPAQIRLGRCARHAVLALSLCSLITMSHPPSYGLPTHFMLSVPAVSQMLPMPYSLVDIAIPESCIAALEVDYAVAGPDPDRCTTRGGAAELLLRWGKLAVASTAASEGGFSHVAMGKAVVRFMYGSGESSDLYSGLLVPDAAVRIMVRVLDTLWRWVDFGPRARLRDAMEAWDLVLGMAYCLKRMDGAGRSAYARALTHMMKAAAEPVAPCWGEHPGPLPPLDPLPPCMLAAYEGRLVPSLERLLRRAGQNLVGPEDHVANHLLNHERVPRLLSLLACAPPGEVASLTATTAKLLRLGYCSMGAVLSDVLPTLTTSANTSLLLAPRLFAAMSGLPAASSPRLNLTRLTEQLLAAMSWGGRRYVAAATSTDVLDVAATLCMTAAPGVMTWVEALTQRCSGRVGAGGSSSGSAAGSDAGATGSSGGAAGSSGSAPGSSAEGGGGGSSDATIAGLRAFLLRDVAVVPLLGALLGLLEKLGKRSAPAHVLHSLLRLASTCCAVAAAWPEDVRRAAAPTADGDSAPGAVPWPPAALRLLAWRLEEGASGERAAGLAERVSALAAALETGGVIGVGVGPWSSGEALEAAGLFAATLAEAQALPPACGNPACGNLAGDSEAGLKLQQCGRCGKVSYCCRECQVAHWKAGHKEACSGGHREG